VIAYRHAPIGQWPGERTPARERQPAYVFKVDYGKLLKDLERELTKLGARETVIQIDVSAMEIRQDGQLYARAKPTSPATIISFDRRRRGQPPETLVFACDRYDHWHANLRAITLTLQALRGIDRWGAVREGQQYAGFRELPAPASAPNGGFASRQHAAVYLTSLIPTGYSIEEIERDPTRRLNLYQALVRQFHPDAPNGDEETMKRIGQARAYLDDEATR
jgi:hypothetical protein